MAICYFHASNLMHIQIVYSFNIPYTTTLTQRPVENVYSICSSISLPAFTCPSHYHCLCSLSPSLLLSFISFLQGSHHLLSLFPTLLSSYSTKEKT